MSEALTDPTAAAVRALESRLHERDELLVCVDFDGVLAPLRDDPDGATILPEARAALAELHSHPDVTVAVVSRRKLKDVRARVDLSGVTYVGNHGLELRTEGVRKVHPGATECQSDVEATCARLRDAFSGTDAVVRNNGQTLSVHHRTDSEQHVRSVRHTVARAVGEFASETLTVRGGDDVVEVRPAIDWDKGSVVSSLLRERASCLPMFVGDARTDEAGFRAVERDGVGVRVGDGDDRATAATEFVRGPREAVKLLEWLCHTGVDRLGGPGGVATRGPRPNATDDQFTQSG